MPLHSCHSQRTTDGKGSEQRIILESEAERLFAECTAAFDRYNTLSGDEQKAFVPQLDAAEEAYCHYVGELTEAEQEEARREAEQERRDSVVDMDAEEVDSRIDDYKLGL